MITAFYVPPKMPKGVAVTDVDQMLCLFQDREGLLWVDLENPTPEETELLATRFGLHPVAIEICREVTSQPLVHDYDDYLFMVIHAVRFETEAAGVETLEVDIRWGRHLVLTYHREPVRAITEVREQCRKDCALLMSRGTDFFLHTIVDRIIDNFTPTLQRIDDLVEECEKEVFAKPSDAILHRVINLKRSVATLGRIAAAQRDIVGRVVRGEFPHVAKQALVYWRDAFDHLVRMVQATDTQRDLLVSVRDTYLSVISNRMNEIMKVLTMIATIFIPVTFIAGIYGMNFQWMPETKQAWGYPAALGMMAAVAGAMVMYFRRKKWL